MRNLYTPPRKIPASVGSLLLSRLATEAKIWAIAFILGAVAFLLTGCESRPKQTTMTDNPDYSVSELFQHDGCRVYRFKDHGLDRYFVTCPGQTISQESCGRHCSDNLDIETVQRE